MKVYRVKNWRKHQSYEGRSPSWIKIFRDLVNPVKEPEYARLSDVAKLHLIHAWLIAAECDGNIPERWLTSERLNVSGKPRIQELVDGGFLSVMADVMASNDENVMLDVKASISVSDSPSASFSQEESFSEIWRDIIAVKIPKPVHKAKAYKHFCASVTTPVAFDAIRVALRNYRQSKRVKDLYIQDASTWFYNWRDWVDYEEVASGNATADVKSPRDIVLDARDAFIASHGKPVTPAEQAAFAAAVGYRLSDVQEYAMSSDGTESIEDWLKKRGAA